MSQPADVRHGYFLLQVRTEAAEKRPALSGVLEDLRTGRRFSFDSLERLQALMHPAGPGPWTED
jgi:hypothetical protein